MMPPALPPSRSRAPAGPPGGRLARRGRARALGLALGALLLAALPLASLAAQGSPAPAPFARPLPGALAVHHSFPEAGSTLRIVVEGFLPGAPVEVLLPQAALAPPSLVEALVSAFLVSDLPSEPGDLHGALEADEQGRVLLTVPLTHRDDALRAFDLAFRDGAGNRAPPLHLVVQPPTLLLPADDSVLRFDLRDGRLLQPAIPGPGLVSAAFSTDGLLGLLLRPGGLLETWSTRDWGGRPFAVTHLDPASDDLAHGGRVGPAFVVVRPEGGPFTPRGRLVFLQGSPRELLVEPLGDDVGGRRWAVEPDGFTAFLAEDDLLVRQVDLLSGAPLGVFGAGLPGDERVADLLLDGRRLLVLTRRPSGQPGSLSVFDLGTGWLSLFPIGIDPLRLVPVGEQRVLVVPAPESGETAGSLVVVQDGVPGAPERLARAGRVLDAAAAPTGARVLVQSDDGTLRLDRWDAGRGFDAFLAQVPPARRLVSGGHAYGLLFGGPDGLVHRVELEDGSLETVTGARTRSDAAFAVLP